MPGTTLFRVDSVISSLKRQGPPLSPASHNIIRLAGESISGGIEQQNGFFDTWYYGYNYECWLLTIMRMVTFGKVLLGDHHGAWRRGPGLVSIKFQDSMKCQYFIDRANSLRNVELGAV